MSKTTTTRKGKGEHETPRTPMCHAHPNDSFYTSVALRLRSGFYIKVP